MPLRRTTIAVAVLAVLLLALAGPGARLGLWGFPTGFTLLRAAAYLGLVAAAAALAQLFTSRAAPGRPALVVAAVLGLIAVGVPWHWLHRARTLPPIHDITTDTQDRPGSSPSFRSEPTPPIRPRMGALRWPPSSVEPIRTSSRWCCRRSRLGRRSFYRALDAARDAGWAIVSSDSAAGRIEATATTGWFGFKDDVVIRIRPAESGSRVDVRSVSRVVSDVGTNAARIRHYLRRLG